MAGSDLKGPARQMWADVVEEDQDNGVAQQGFIRERNFLKKDAGIVTVVAVREGVHINDLRRQGQGLLGQRQNDGEEFADRQFPGQREAGPGRGEAAQSSGRLLVADVHGDREVDSEAQVAAVGEVVVFFKELPKMFEDDRHIDVIIVKISGRNEIDPLAMVSTTRTVFFCQQEFVRTLRAGQVDTKAPLPQQRR